MAGSLRAASFAALTAALASATALGLAVVRAAAPAPEVASLPPVVPIQPSTIPVRQLPTEVRLDAAVDRDPFQPSRRRPAHRFRLPGEALPGERADSLLQLPPLRLIGTAVLPGGRSFALCQVGVESPRLVRVGERIGGFTLETVERARAVFLTAAGAPLSVAVPKAGS